MTLKIECPKCKWQPHANSLWACSCGHEWNTFDTAGRCPNCKKIWEDTQCHDASLGGCAGWSKHLDWYVDLDETLRREIEAIQMEQPIAI